MLPFTHDPSTPGPDPTPPAGTSLSSAGPIFFASTYGVAVANTAAANKIGIDAAIAAAVALGGGLVILPAAPNTTPLLTNGGHEVSAGIDVCGGGSQAATTVLNRGATYTFRLMNETSGKQAGALHNMQVVGSDGGHAAVNGGIGYELANGLSHVCEDVFVYGFTGTGSVGIRFHNIDGTAKFVEQVSLRHVFISNCTTHIQFRSDAAGGTSFAYINITGLELLLYDNQVGIDIGGPSGGLADLYNSRIEGSIHYIGNNAIGVLVTAQGQVTKGVTLDLRGEHDSGTGQVRIKNQGKFNAEGRFTVSGTQPPDDYSTGTEHEWAEHNLPKADLAAASRTVAAAWPITIPGGSDIWDVTGTSPALHSFVGGPLWEGRVFTLRIVNGLTLVHNASFLSLAGGVDFVAAAGSRITLVWHDNVVYEIARTAA